MAKPAGALCNLACEYCYYTEKKHLYAQTPHHVMSDALLERFTRDYIQAQPTPNVLFTWHGGEALMRPVSFYQKALDLQRKYAEGRHIDNALQTNATLLTDEWAEFLAKNHFLVGVSIDGPQEFHDEYRKSRTGRPSFMQVLRGIRLLQKHGVEWNALAVVNDYNADYPLDFYRFFRDELSGPFLQFTPVVERIEPHSDGRHLASVAGGTHLQLAPFSVSPGQWGDFLCAIFDEWVRRDVGKMFVQLFDATLANWVGVMPGVCTLAETCGHALAMEFQGDVYCCDHFVFPEYKLGNIYERPLVEMLQDERQRQFGLDKREALTRECRECDYLFACHGECPRLRFATDSYGNQRHNYLCRGYKKFFAHVAPYMDRMKKLLQEGRAPAEIMHEV
ncbi:MAG: anaerobic sulfatase-maturation protein [Alloprevotella sp.]|nr:anaerobic sulfatase-maturation protein [Alloprevotella sp.]